MKRKLIDEFREKANHPLVRHIYLNQNNKNKWNIICSAMDWISVVVESIDAKTIENSKNDNEKSVQVITLITCIDLLWEAIQQLHRVLFNTDSIPFIKEKTIFKDEIANQDDNTYFKKIRACFAAHTSNLKDNFLDEKEQEQRYASWSWGLVATGFNVYLYSNEINTAPILFHVDFNELFKFADARYNYLSILIKKLDENIEAYSDKLCQTKIKKSCAPLSQIKILEEEAKKRFGDADNYYLEILKRIEFMLTTQISNIQNKNVVDQYKEALNIPIKEIFNKLQNMILEDMQSEEIIYVEIPSECLFALSKISESVFGCGPKIIMLEKFYGYLNDIVNLEEYNSINELYVIIIAGFYKKNTMAKEDN